MARPISLLKHIAAWFLFATVVWSFSISQGDILPNSSTCSRYGLNGWQLLACRSLPSVMFVRCVSSAVFVCFLPRWFSQWLDRWAGVFVSARILRAAWRGARDPRLDRLIGHCREPCDGCPESQCAIWSDHNTVLGVLETTASASGVPKLNYNAKQKQGG
ncbi:hypothetical protein PpBr36_08226 [Pyricularia pennisetigena]|uniref:hypothetical protein n=1 Tax=Pyricularia pennisetigena TaxID=1578925 RepID=UPI00114FFDF8|nr:hypothetical protein PpBr36_08226 [Pyricularia pennisetigena]TLS23886.1 hypothetical protein PpBr36_08226 [Pyricularia pennisetigena]